MGTYRTMHPTIRKYLFFGSIHETFIKSDPILNHRTSVTNDWIYTILTKFSGYNVVKLEIIKNNIPT